MKMHYNASHCKRKLESSGIDVILIPPLLGNRDQARERLPCGPRARAQPNICLAIEDVALRKYSQHTRERLAIATTFDAVVTLPNHPIPMLLRRGLQPDRIERIQQSLECGGLGNQSASSSQHDPGPGARDAFQRAALVASVSRLPPEVENFVHLDARLGFDFAAQLDKRPAQVAREQRPERSLARTAKPDQSDSIESSTAIAETVGEHLRSFRKFRGVETAEPLDQPRICERTRRIVADEFRNRRVDRVCNSSQQRNRKVTASAFQLRQVALRNSRIPRQHPTRDPRIGAD